MTAAQKVGGGAAVLVVLAGGGLIIYMATRKDEPISQMLADTPIGNLLEGIANGVAMPLNWMDKAATGKSILGETVEESMAEVDKLKNVKPNEFYKADPMKVATVTVLAAMGLDLTKSADEMTKQVFGLNDNGISKDMMAKENEYRAQVGYGITDTQAAAVAKAALEFARLSTKEGGKGKDIALNDKQFQAEYFFPTLLWPNQVIERMSSADLAKYKIQTENMIKNPDHGRKDREGMNWDLGYQAFDRLDKELSKRMQGGKWIY